MKKMFGPRHGERRKKDYNSPTTGRLFDKLRAEGKNPERELKEAKNKAIENKKK